MQTATSATDTVFDVPIALAIQVEVSAIFLVATFLVVAALIAAFLGTGGKLRQERRGQNATGHRRQSGAKFAGDRRDTVIVVLVAALLVPFAVAGSSFSLAAIAALLGVLFGFGITDLAARLGRWEKSIEGFLFVVGAISFGVVVVQFHWAQDTIYYAFAFGSSIGILLGAFRRLRSS